jgi:hypothetical protein
MTYYATIHCASCNEDWETFYSTDRPPEGLPAVGAPVFERSVDGLRLPCAAPAGASRAKRAPKPRAKAPRVETCEAFGYKCAWIAVRTRDPEALASKLLVEPARASWKEGIDAAYRGAIFVTPAVEGWAFVVSTSFFEAADDPAALLRPVGRGAQYFASDRVIGLHVAAKASERRELDNEEAVMRLAGRWGMNPQTLSSIAAGTGEAARGWLSYTPLALRQR